MGTAFEYGSDPSAPMEGASSISPALALERRGLRPMGYSSSEAAYDTTPDEYGINPVKDAFLSYSEQAGENSSRYPGLNKYEEGVVASTPFSTVSSNLTEFNNFMTGALGTDPSTTGRFEVGNIFNDDKRLENYQRPLNDPDANFSGSLPEDFYAKEDNNIASNNLEVKPVTSIDDPSQNQSSLDKDIDANISLEASTSQTYELPAEQQKRPGYFSPERRQERQQNRAENRMDRETNRGIRAEERAKEDALRKEERDTNKQERQLKREERKEFRNRPFTADPLPPDKLDMTGYTTPGSTTAPGGSPYGWQSSFPSANDDAVASAQSTAQQKQNQVTTYQEDPNLKKETVTGEPTPEGDKCPKGYKKDKETGECVATNTGQFRERNAAIALNALKYWSEKAGMDEKRKAEVNQRKSYLPDVYMAGAVKGTDRGSEDVNTAMRPGWGVYGTTYEPRYELLGKFGGSRGSNVQYLTDAEIARIISMGGEVEFLD